MVAALAVAFLSATGRARAAALVVSGSNACVDANAIAEQAGELLGRPLDAVAGVDFEVALTRAPAGGWRLRLDTIDAADGGRRSRALAAANCAELADVAAVGIAMSVRALAEAARPEAPRVPPAPPTVQPPSPPAAPPVISRPPAAPPPAPTTFAGGLAVVGDAGALPNPGIGVELGAALRHRRVRLAVAGTALASQVTRTAGGAGGEFRLLFGSAQACLPYALGRTTLLGCGGFELGRLSGVGVGIVRPHEGAARWQAARVELGLSFPVAARVALLVRAGGALPLSQTQFVVDGAPVHRPAASSPASPWGQSWNSDRPVNGSRDGRRPTTGRREL